MAAAPWFVIGPSALLAVLGHRRGPDPAVPTPAEDWREARVDVVIQAGADQHHIVQCLASLLRQTRPPRRIVLVEDCAGARDHTVQFAREFAQANRMALEIVVRAAALGKAVTLKRQAREFDGEVLFALDADTVLDSPDYIERCVRELYQGVGIASACGSVLPLWPAQRHALTASVGFQRWLGGDAYHDPLQPLGWPQRAWGWFSDSYGDCLARVEQGFIHAGLMARYGGIARPFGGAVAYRRRYLKDLFDRYEPIRGDDLGEVEDLFLGPALNTEGYRNIQLADVVARVHYPRLHQLPRRAYRWSVSFLQGGHYFDALLCTPLRRPRRRRRDRGLSAIVESRTVAEAYRQPFGERLTARYGRPIGTAVLLAAVERIGYPAVLLVLAVLGQWLALALVIAIEALLALAVLATLAPPRGRRAALWQGALVTPLRYGLIFAELFAVLHFALQLWLTGKRRWFAHRHAAARAEPGAQGATGPHSDPAPP